MILIVALLLQVERVERDARCSECHVDEAEEVRTSVHGLGRIGCISCHGVDEIESGKAHKRIAGFRGKRRQDIAENCGACHQAELESMKLGGHYGASKRGQNEPRFMRGCKDCHESHATARAKRVDLWAGCVKCHEKEPELLDAARALFGGMGELERRLAEPLDRWERRPGIDASAARDARSAAGEAVHNLRISQHGLRFKELEAGRGAAAASVDAAYNRLIRGEEAFGRRWVWLAPFLALVIAGMGLVIAKKGA